MFYWWAVVFSEISISKRYFKKRGRGRREFGEENQDLKRMVAGKNIKM